MTTATQMIRSLDDFQRNTAEHLKRLRETGEAEVLTVDGRAELVVQSAAAYEKLLDLADLAESTAILKQRVAAADAGQKGIPVDEAFAEIRKRLGLEEPG